MDLTQQASALKSPSKNIPVVGELYPIIAHGHNAPRVPPFPVTGELMCPAVLPLQRVGIATAETRVQICFAFLQAPLDSC